MSKQNRDPNSTDWMKAPKAGADGAKASPFGAPKLSAAAPTTVPVTEPVVPVATPQAAPVAAQAVSAPATAQAPAPIVAPQPLPAAGAPVAQQVAQPVAQTIIPSVQVEQQPVAGQYASSEPPLVLGTPNTATGGMAPVAVPQQALQGQQVGRLLITDPNQLIQLPGDKEPRTAQQLNFERKSGKDLDKLQSVLSSKEQTLKEKEAQLVTRERELEAQRNQTIQMPQMPAGYVPGDPEFADFDAQVDIYKHQKAVMPLIAPILQQAQDQQLGQYRQEIATSTLDYNNALINTMYETLPFDYNALNPKEQEAINGRIIRAARDRRVSFDDATLSSAKLHPDTIELIKMEALQGVSIAQPQVSLTPNTGQYQAAPVSDPSQQANALLSIPLVPKAPEPPPLQPGTPGIAAPLAGMAPKQKFGQRSERNSDWLAKLGPAT